MTRVERNRIAAAAVGTRPGRIITAPAPQPVSRNLAARTSPVKGAIGPVRRSRALPLTATQRRGDGSGARSDWSASPEFFTDPAWSQTLHNRHV